VRMLSAVLPLGSIEAVCLAVVQEPARLGHGMGSTASRCLLNRCLTPLNFAKSIVSSVAASAHRVQKCIRWTMRSFPG
jgi:hypothetical protein